MYRYIWYSSAFIQCHTDHTMGSVRKPQLLRNLWSDHGLARRQGFWNIIIRGGDPCWRSPTAQQATRKWEAVCPAHRCCVVGKHQRWKAAVWRPTGHVTDCWRRSMEPIYRSASHPAGFGYCWRARVGSAPSLHWHLDGDKCPVGVVATMAAEKLAVQGKTHLGCCIVERYCCLGREPGCKCTPCRCLCAQELGCPQKTASRWIRLLRLKWLRWM